MLKKIVKIVYFYFFGSKKSYSQTGEDLIVNFYLSQIENGFYVDVGAHHPVSLNNTYLFYKRGWRGIAIEPNIYLSKFFHAIRRKDTVLNLGVGEKSSQLDFYNMDPDTLSTFSNEKAQEYVKLGHKLENVSKVAVKPLKEILTEHVKARDIDLLNVDTEGFDLEVLKSNDWHEFRPKVVILEVVDYKRDHGIRKENEMSEFMNGVGYVKLADTYINAIYMEKSYALSRKII